LGTIKDFVQQVVEAVAAAIGVEVMVFDLNRSIVAGTGETKFEVGSRYNKGSLTGRLLETGKTLVARLPGRSPECLPCNNYGACPHYMVVAFPIKAEGEILGSFCLVAVDEQQRQRILANEENLLLFLERMCLLIGNAVSEKKAQDQLNVLLKRYDNVVNSVHEGIISTDQKGRIIHCNQSSCSLLGSGPDQFIGRRLNELFPDLPPEKIRNKNQPLETEVCYRYKGRKVYFLATIVPVLAQGSVTPRGVTVSLRNIEEVRSYAARLVGEYSKYSFDDILGVSPGILQAKASLGRAARTDSTILIRGESGTGKEIFAHAVHAAGYRSKGPFVAINCSAIPESLLESELFGYMEGAFTGAKKGGKPGKFELAEGGTLFLDEIGDMPIHLQSKLLRVLENRSIERVGGTEPLPVDVRIIAATNQNLEEMVDRHEFRGDLYYRLSVIPVFIPPLRERKEDIPVLIDHFLEKYGQKLARGTQELDERSTRTLIGYDWPGNVRELQNAIEYAINMSEPGQTITVDHLPQRITGDKNYFAISKELKATAQGEGQPESPAGLPGPEWLDEARQQLLAARSRPQLSSRIKALELELINEALKYFGTSTGGKEKASRYLGISLSTLYRRLRETDLKLN